MNPSTIHSTGGASTARPSRASSYLMFQCNNSYMYTTSLVLKPNCLETSEWLGSTSHCVLETAPAITTLSDASTYESMQAFQPQRTLGQNIYLSAGVVSSTLRLCNQLLTPHSLFPSCHSWFYRIPEKGGGGYITEGDSLYIGYNVWGIALMLSVSGSR